MGADLRGRMYRVMEEAAALSTTAVVVMSLALVLLVGIADITTGADMAFSGFYLPAIFLAGASGLRWVRLGAAGAATLTWIIADLLARTSSYAHPAIAVWNGTMRFFIFWLLGALTMTMRASRDHERSLSRTDPLTGLPNLRAFYVAAHAAVQRQRRSGEPLTMAYFDVDEFKKVNDTLGHEAGDELLRQIGRMLAARIRATDVVARLGGDEFAMLLPGTSRDGAALLLEGVRAQLLELARVDNLPVSFSIGSVTWEEPPELVAEMVRQADSLMYEVKRTGKNAVAAESVRRSSVVPA